MTRFEGKPFTDVDGIHWVRVSRPGDGFVWYTHVEMWTAFLEWPTEGQEHAWSLLKAKG